MQRVLIRRLGILVALVSFADFIFGATVVVHMLNGGLTGATIGIALAVSGVLSLAVETPSGAWGDKHGQRRILVIGLVLWGLGLLAFGFAQSMLIFTVALVLWGIGQSCYSGAPTSLVLNRLHEEIGDEGIAGVMRKVHVIRWTASGAAAASVFLTAEHLAVDTTIIVAGALLLPVALWVRLRWPEQRSETKDSTARLLGRGLRLAVTGELRTQMIHAALIGFLLTVLILTWQPLSMETIGLRPESLGLVLLVFTAASAVGAWGTRFTERFGARRVLPIGLVLTCAVMLTVGAGAVATGAALVAAEALTGLLMCLNAIRAQQLFPDALRTTMTSIMSAVLGLSMALGDFVTGLLWEFMGVEAAVRWCALSVAVGCLAVYIADRFKSAANPEVAGEPETFEPVGQRG
ncbi:MFS transporter [Glycomyces luteolus]|uniref:MFS transporter n=1 Tax=Glycomyces luteolus TaxID=2670330 RepID=A0A9X3SS80_9ACTN|nr:MFS transporter [Glycomyces luteolus]MDA1360914.1 MFS transporter [Glycomyces luteolus]